MPNLNNNKGILLISAFMMAGVLIVLSGSYVTSSIVQSQAVQRQNNSLKAFYAAELGAEFVYAEAKNHSWNFITHEIAATDSDNDGKINDLVPKPSPPTVSYAGASINQITGCYEIAIPQDTVEVKVYADPAHPVENILLSRGKSTKGDSSHIIKNRLAYESLYRFLMFFPDDTSFYDSYDGKGTGCIHVNGNIKLANGARFTDLKEISASGYFSHKRWQYIPPYQLDDNDGTRDGFAHMYKAAYPPYDYYLPYIQYNSNPSGYVDLRNNKDKYFHGDAKINGITIPKELDTEWQWDKYSGLDADSNPLGKPELPVTVIVPQAELDRVGAADANDYWTKIYGANPTNVNPEWWDDKVYGNGDRGAGIESIPVKYTNSQYQAEDWAALLKDNNLDSIITDKNSGGRYLTPINVNKNYPALAKDNGLYIGDDGSGGLEVYLNGVLQPTLPSWIEDNVQFFNVSHIRLDTGGQPVKENILQFDISKLVDSPANQKLNNSIIYVDHKNIRLVNAAKLPEKGLTVVSPYNIYLKGNYNTDAAWQPSAVITNSLVYTLSEDFNDPQVLPLPRMFKEYPYSLENQEFLNQYCSGSRYPSELPAYPAGELTSSWIKSNLTGSQQLTLRNSGEEYYVVDNDGLMPNRAVKDTTYNVAIAAFENPYPQSLERWDEDNTTLTVLGSFIELENPWSEYRDIPDFDYDYGANKGWGSVYRATAPLFQFNYEDRYKTEGGTPPGDFGSAAVAHWEEVYDFNHI